MDKQNVANPYNGVLLARNTKGGVLIQAITWMTPENNYADWKEPDTIKMAWN